LRSLVRSRVTNQGVQLDATGRLFAVDTLGFGPGKTGFPTIEATLTVDAFVYGNAAGAVVPAEPTPPATTDTTATTTTDTTAGTDGTTPPDGATAAGGTP
jgi:hypothetical protein